MKISLENIFNGNVNESMKGLNESIDCCLKWKEHYLHVGFKINNDLKWYMQT